MLVVGVDAVTGGALDREAALVWDNPAEISGKLVCPRLRSIRYGVYTEELDTFLDMLASRLTIEDASGEQWETINSLCDQEICNEMSEPPLNEYYAGPPGYEKVSCVIDQ